MIEVGQTYTSKNGHKWLCIASDGEYAHMRMDGVPHSAAYAFTTDGTNISQCGGDWNIEFAPARETLVVRGGFVTGYLENATVHPEYADHKFTMIIDLVDGVADWDNAKVAAA